MYVCFRDYGFKFMFFADIVKYMYFILEKELMKFLISLFNQAEVIKRTFIWSSDLILHN